MATNLIDQLKRQSVVRVGRVIADHRNRLGQIMSQERLGDDLGISRTVVAHLEEGRELPKTEQLIAICEKLEIQDKHWVAATHDFYSEGCVFHELVCELVGRRISMTDHSASDQLVALDRASTLFNAKLSDAQAHTEFNSLLVFYGERPVTKSFFERYLGGAAFASNARFLDRVRVFQAEAMRLYGNFRRAFTLMSRSTDLEVELRPLQAKSLKSYEERSKFSAIREIAPDRLADLGYIAVQRITQQNKDRVELSVALLKMADEVTARGSAALNDTTEKVLRRMRTLLRKFDSPLQLEQGLFSEVDAIMLRSEAARIKPEAQDLVRIEQTQSQGLHNLGVYLSEPHMDVYVATSMREDADFHSVNNFVQTLFADQHLEPLNLRYFNPTQSWIADRVAKGLVEALMLRRAAVTVYMAQKGDTFGKDSEASVALGQGKAVIVYVPRLFHDEANINSEKLFRLDIPRLNEMLAHLQIEPDDDLDQREKARQVLRGQLAKVSETQFLEIISRHWADFDLLGETAHIGNRNLKEATGVFLRQFSAATSGTAMPSEIDGVLREEITDMLVQTADKFESRARTFRDIHPLALQVIVRSGILNGIMVTRSVTDCARLLREVLENTVQTDVEVDDSNYRLVERQTRSTLRVVSRHRLLTFAFWSQYFEEGSASSSSGDLPAVPL